MCGIILSVFISEDNAKPHRQPETRPPPVPTHREELRTYDAVPVSTSTTTSTIPTPGLASTSPASEANQTQRVWVTMGLCWGHNAQVLGKEQFPYQEAALRAVQLWHKLTPATVVLTIAHTGSSSNSSSGDVDGVDPALLRYADTMRGHGARVALHRVQRGPGQLSCVLSAQLVR